MLQKLSNGKIYPQSLTNFARLIPTERGLFKCGVIKSFAMRGILIDLYNVAKNSWSGRIPGGSLDSPSCLATFHSRFVPNYSRGAR